MSFLNPVNEPVLRFSSTDASAPQINYAARTAGDIKAVLKACLVTGYGAKASAGWTAVNEAATVIEFVSPSVAMSDYRLGIDDTSGASTTWYYQHQDVRVNPISNTPRKALGSLVSPHSNNGWQLLVSSRGILFIELVQNSAINDQVARMTWFGQMKLATALTTGRNISYWCAGYGAPESQPANVFNNVGIPKHFYDINGDTTSLKFDFIGATNFVTDVVVYSGDPNAVEVASPLFLSSSQRVMAQHPAVLLSKPITDVAMYGTRQVILGDKTALRIFLTYSDARAEYVKQVGRYATVVLENWEY